MAPDSSNTTPFNRNKNQLIKIPAEHFPGLLFVSGKDAATFLHGQLTNEVKALKPGETLTQSRVTRTGHLTSIFRMKAVENGYYLLFSDQSESIEFKDELEGFLFSEDVSFSAVDHFKNLVYLASPDSGLFPEIEKNLSRSTKSTEPALPGSSDAKSDLEPDKKPEAEPEFLLIENSLTGDPGANIFFKSELSDTDTKIFLDENFEEINFKDFNSEKETLRIEGGILKKNQDYFKAKTLLPETALEAELVSYSKGCYLGQEVIARTKTYGSTPFALRGLIFEGTRLEDLLNELPEISENILQITEENPQGLSIGKIQSRSASKSLNKVIAIAYLSRNSRTPGQELTLKGKTMPLFARVVLLPFIGSKGSKEKVHSLFDQAVKFYSKGLDDEAIATMEDVLRIDPSFHDAYETLGVMLGKSEKYHEAIEIFRRLEEIAPSEPLVNTNLSLYLMKIGNKDEAEKEATKATIKSFSKAADGFSAKELEKQQLDLEQNAAKRKKEMFEEVLDFDPDDPIALFGLGNAFVTLDKFAEAEISLKKALQFDSKNSAVYLSLGKVLEKNDKKTEAIEVYSKGIKEASIKGDLMPLKEMETRQLLLKR